MRSIRCDRPHTIPRRRPYRSGGTDGGYDMGGGMSIFKRLRPTPAHQQKEIQEWMPDDLIKGGYGLVMDHCRGGYAEGFDRNADNLFLRLGWPKPQRFKLSDQPEWFNIAGLYWKPI